MLDLKISGGTVVDGTGAQRRRADVGVKDGRIVAVGEVSEPARETIDATGRIVAPGFIDSHTHFDAQVFWEPTLSPSCFHGVTTVFGGFCGFSIAPITPEAADYIKPMLARVEGMPLETLDKAVPWNWSTFGEFLGRIEAGKVGLNAGFFAGHSAIRRVVMGKRAVGEKSTPQELEAMKTLLDNSLREGAIGFSTTIAATHNDGDGNPVPSRWADFSEIVELARIVSKHPGTGVELLPDLEFPPEVRKLMADVSIASQRAVNWNAVGVTKRPDSEAMIKRQLEITDYARSRGGEVIALTIPCPVELYMNLRTGFVFDALPGVWREMFKLPVEERMKLYRDPAYRKRMEADAPIPSTSAIESFGRIADYRVAGVLNAANKKYEGRRVRDIAEEEKKSPIDVILDLALADNLETTFAPDISESDRKSYELRARLWKDDRTLIGGSDAGAHLDMIDSFAATTVLLEKGVREFKVITLEQAINKITGRPAQYFGLIDRGLIKTGYHADLVVFDEAGIKNLPATNRYDLPGGKDFRIYGTADGIDHVFVNGVEIVRKGEHTGKLPGKVLRSGKDTRTVPLDALRERAAAAE